MKNCAFTGHRPKSLPFGYNESEPECRRMKDRLRETVEKLITEEGVIHFISGMAMGVDMYAAEEVLALKEKYPHITLECALPCETQAEKWSEDMRVRYFGIIEKSDKETLLQNRYTNDCMMKRNRYMVDKCDVLVAVWNGKKSGTANTVNYALATGKRVIVIDPENLT